MKMPNTLANTFIALALSGIALGQHLTLPQQPVAGQATSINTTGSGNVTFYLTGPGSAIKRSIKLGDTINLSAEDLAYAGRYEATLNDGTSQSFYVVPAAPQKLNFMARPSRVPVAQPNVISGAVLVLDHNENLVLSPVAVNFHLGLNGAPAVSHVVTSKDGVAWIKAGSGNREGAAQFTASIGDVTVRRVVQQVASDPCNLRMKAQKQGDRLLLETEPIKDCSGNPVPDGTIVTFIQTGGSNGRSTMDARVKHGIARATLPAVPGATLSVASGVVLGNEIHWGGGQ